MKNSFLISVLVLSIMACNGPQENQIKERTNDSLVKQVEHKDSAIMNYVHSLNTIQGGIDSLVKDEKILKMHGAERMTDTATLISELRAIGRLIIKNQRALANLERKLKESNEANNELADLGEHLSLELNEKDSEIAATQRMLVKTKASLGNLVKQFNDSINVIVQQRAQIGLMTAAGNIVYYVFGTEKDLKDRGIIVNEGGVIGLGRVPLLNGDMNASGFTKADLTNLHEIQFNGILVKMVTPHPLQSYRVMHAETDKLIITDPQDFWSKSKYMVAIEK